MDPLDGGYGIKIDEGKMAIKTRILLSLFLRSECVRLRYDLGPRLDEFAELARLCFGPEAPTRSLPYMAGNLPSVLLEWNDEYVVLKPPEGGFNSLAQLESYVVELINSYGEWFPLKTPWRD